MYTLILDQALWLWVGVTFGMIPILLNSICCAALASLSTLKLQIHLYLYSLWTESISIEQNIFCKETARVNAGGYKPDQIDLVELTSTLCPGAVLDSVLFWVQSGRSTVQLLNFSTPSTHTSRQQQSLKT